LPISNRNPIKLEIAFRSAGVLPRASTEAESYKADHETARDDKTDILRQVLMSTNDKPNKAIIDGSGTDARTPEPEPGPVWKLAFQML
jgi:hypothetical protein